MFSKQVILDIINTLPNNYDPLESFLIRYDLDEKIDTSGLTTAKIKMAITKYLIANQGIKDNFGNNIVLKIVEERVNDYLLDEYSYNYIEEKNEFKSYPQLYKYLRYDGYDIQNGKLVRTLSDDIKLEAKEDEISYILQINNFTTTLGHLENAKSSYFNSNYPALTGQLRTYVESLFVDLAKEIKNKDTNCQEIANIVPQNATTAMQLLAKCTNPIIIPNLNEWDGGNRKTFIEGFWNRLHPLGSHPGIPDVDESVYRFQLVLLVTYNLLKRYEKFYT